MNLNRNVFIHFVGKVIPALSQLVVLVLGVRLLGTQEYGKYNLLFSTSMIIASLMVGWIQQSILRFAYEQEEGKKKTGADFYSLAFPATLVALVVTFVFCLFYFDITILEIAVVALFTAFFAVFLVSLTLKQANADPFSYAVTESFFYGSSIIVFLAGTYWLGIQSSALIFEGMLLSLIVWFVFRILKSKRTMDNLTGIILKRPGKAFFQKMFNYGAPITIWLLISNFYNVFDRYIINYYLGYTAVGVYGSVYDLIYKIGGFMTLPVLLTYHPAISKKWNEGDLSKGKQLIIHAVISELLIMVVMFSALFFLKDMIFEAIFSRKIPELNVLFIPISISAVLWQITMIIQKPLEFNFKQKLMIAGIIITVLANGVLNLITIPKFGFSVAAYNTLICTSFYFLVVLYYSGLQFKTKH